MLKGLDEDCTKQLTDKFRKLREKALHKGVKVSTIQTLFLPVGATKKNQWTQWIFPCSLLFVGFLLIQMFRDVSIYEMDCVIPSFDVIQEMFRPAANCTMCKGIRKMPVEVNISTEKFLKKYAYSAQPVLIKGATANWSALTMFSYKFFKALYLNSNGNLKTESECQFFPYQTMFMSLEEFFNMTDERAALEQGEENWYVGWSNCDELAKEQLRLHYQKPYFLPYDTDYTVDWIFIGGSGNGASVHIDSVSLPSWQAQIRGRKSWRLIPPPECEEACPFELNVTMERGDIIVVDTNQWFHSTFVHPGDISISIGSEFDLKKD